jgi:hypothetical protein
VALGLHYLAYKARTVNEEWAEVRAADLRSKSYDASHIASIAERHGVTPDGAAEKNGQT